MKIPNNYHSAFSEDLKYLEEIDYYSENNSIALFHDINNGVNELFYNCDFICCDLAWRNGYEKFKERAKIESFGYNHYLNSIKNVIFKLGKPTFLIGGKHMLNKMKPENYINIKHHNMPALVLIWNYGNNFVVKDYNELTNYLAIKFDRILDFTCGYGLHLWKFKSFIVSDINKKCVYYIAKKYLGL